ncbi:MULTISPECIES: hypothetical protein [unclassified Psychrobacter]|uniref:hypothetical protein n=1 Tax=unclassified Psychrobacter TaxID=196806 RepID=UPI003F481C7E
MEPITILFFALSSFLRLEHSPIVADKTTVTIQPQGQQIEIIQEDLFTIVHKDDDLEVVKEEQTALFSEAQQNTAWAKELNSFTDKAITFSSTDNQLNTHITLTYQDETDLRALGVWYDAQQNQFSINYIPNDNLQTEDGQRLGNYWVFDGDKTFSFTLEPFKALPTDYKSTDYQKYSIPITVILDEN